MIRAFWGWYDRNKTLNLGIAAILFSLQLVHLYWLTTHVVAHRILGVVFFDPSPLLQNLIILVDYTEIPALIATTLVYVNQLRRGLTLKPILFLLLINSQLLHIFWITDEIVLATFTGNVAIGMPVWLSWIAILIDYLELPVIFDVVKNFLGSLKSGNLRNAFTYIRKGK